jgi:hypothetical protein
MDRAFRFKWKACLPSGKADIVMALENVECNFATVIYFLAAQFTPRRSMVAISGTLNSEATWPRDE